MKIYYVACLLLFLTACNKGGQKDTPAAGPGANRTNYDVAAIEGFVVKSALLSEHVTASGSILPAEETVLHPEASGRVVSINLPEGKKIAKGTLLLKIFDDDLKTQLQQLDIQLKQAQITEQRLADLLKVKGISQQEYDLAVLQVQTLKSQMDLVRINIGKTELRAPYDGVLGLRNISPGAYVTPATEVTTIRATNTLKLDFSVPEKYSTLLNPGQTVAFAIEGSDLTYSAKVLASEQRIDANTRNLQLRAQVLGNIQGLLPGAFAEVTINLRSKPKALMVPSQSLVPQARDKKVYVNRNGKADFITVQTGVRQAGMVEITDGLSVGDTIATTGILFLRPGANMTFSKIN